MATLETIPYPKTEQEWEDFRKKVNALKNKANNRLKKLEKNKLENTPAYKAFTTYHGEPRFGIKGKTREQVRAEYFKIKHFLESSTSTVKGAEKYLSRQMSITGLKGGNAQGQIANFWGIADELRKSMQAVKRSYLALDSERVINSVRQVIQENEEGADDLESMGDALLSAWAELERELPNAVSDDVINYLTDYIDNLGLDGITINFNL